MKTALSQDQIQSYRQQGYLLVDGFLNKKELRLGDWQSLKLLGNKAGNSGHDAKVGEDDGINKESDYFGKVFDQMLNLWQTNDKVKQLMLSKEIGEMAAAWLDVKARVSGTIRH